MPEIARTRYSLRPAAAPVSNKFKLLFSCIILTASYFSGKIPVLNDSASKDYIFEETLTDTSNKNLPKFDNGKIEQVQIAQIDIGSKKFVPPTPVPEKPSENVWGVAKKIDTHTYTMRVKKDDVMASPQEILTALNTYRKQYGRGVLSWDDKLADFANRRAEYFYQAGKLDNHAGFLEYLNNQDGFRKLGFGSIGENSSIGFTLEAVHLIEWIYGGDAEHNDNQLNKDWGYVGIGVKDNAVDFIFARDKLYN